MKQPEIYPIQPNYLYQGKVVDNQDPDKKGRVKVEVEKLTTGIAKDKLPWYVILPVAGAGNNQSVAIPTNDTVVFVTFPNGDIYNGVVQYSLSSIKAQ